MRFDFLFQSYEGVLSLTKRKAKILTILSITGLIISVGISVALAFDLNNARLIPGIIVLASIFALDIIFLIQGNYKTAVYSIFLLPVSLYFLCINDYYSIVDATIAQRTLLSSFYGGFLFLVVFGDRVAMFLGYMVEVLVTTSFYLYQNEILFPFTIGGHQSIFSGLNPLLEVLVVGAVFVLVFRYFYDQIQDSTNKLKKTKENESNILQNANAGIMYLKVTRDRFGEKNGMIVTRTNHLFDQLFNVSKAEIINTDFSIIFPKLFRDSFNWQQYFYHSSKKYFETHIPHLNKWFGVYTVSPEKDQLIVSFINTTKLHDEVERVVTREKRLTNLMGALPDIFFIIEKDGIYVDYVTNNEELMKLGQDDIIGKSIFDMGYSNAMSFQILTSIQKVIEQDNIETIEYGMELASGKYIMFEMRLARLNETQVISIGRDVTNKKEVERYLKEAKRKTEEAGRLKMAFLGNVSHEMRTPMNSIIGFSSMATSEDYSDEDRRMFLKVIGQNAELLNNIISDVLDLSEIESGSVALRMKSVKLKELMYDLFKATNNRIDMLNSQAQLILEIPENTLEIEILTDNNLLSKIMFQLLSNAIKFTPEGEISLGYQVESMHVKLFVLDTGVGINKEDQQRIFDYFHQLDNNLSKKFAGTGAGLAIVKNYLEMLGTSIEFTSELGVGTKFMFELPIKSKTYNN